MPTNYALCFCIRTTAQPCRCIWRRAAFVWLVVGADTGSHRSEQQPPSPEWRAPQSHAAQLQACRREKGGQVSWKKRGWRWRVDKRAGGWRRDSVPKLHLNCFSFSAEAKALSNLPSAISRSPITFSLYACMCPHNKRHTPPPISSQYLLSMCCIAGNFQGRKLSRIGEKYNFHGGNFRGLLTFATPKDAMPQILRKKLSCIVTKPWNLWKFSAIRYSGMQYQDQSGRRISPKPS